MKQRALFLVKWMVLVLAALIGLQAYAAEPATAVLEGDFHAIWTDDFEIPENSYIQYVVIDDKGQSMVLNSCGMSGTPDELDAIGAAACAGVGSVVVDTAG